jgi:hypothetical protein
MKPIDAILALIENAAYPLASCDIDMPYSTVAYNIAQLRAAGKVHVAGWRRTSNSPNWLMLLAPGNLPDAPKPLPMSKAEVNARKKQWRYRKEDQKKIAHATPPQRIKLPTHAPKYGMWVI